MKIKAIYDNGGETFDVLLFIITSQKTTLYGLAVV